MPPPLGGIGVINKSFQQIVSPEWNVLSYNTSTGQLNEEIYKSKGFKNLFHFAKNISGLTKFITKNKFKIVNVFVTSNVAFIRDSFIILILWLCKKKIIVHFHSKKKGEFFLGNLTIRYISFTFKFVKKIIILSEDHYCHFSQYFNKSKMIIIENFVDYYLYDCKIENKSTEFLYVSRLSMKKGIFDLIEAVRVVKEKGLNPKVNILGTEENDEVKNTINTSIEKYGLEQNIILHGSVYGTKKYEFFKSCSTFIFPSHFENSPVVLKEAIASKMALICSDIEANKNILSDKGNTKFFKIGNPFDLANKIEYMMMNPLLVKDFMQQSEKCKIYDKKCAAEEINRVFHTLLE